ncbi:aromatic acid exporter family protein [Streptomyces sp. NPDC057002]|uniref:FUSC family protein n=1 Tax=Streptomyces sp. NPDC057002 TaxID=3345992 RepID=UPI00364241AB
MTEAAAGAPRPQAASPGRPARVRQWFGRAGSDGHERHTLALIGKSTLAAAVSWVIARDVMAAQSPAFAPFSAVLIMQVTVYQSLVQALRYVGAVAVGVGLQGVLGLLAGPHLLTFALMTLAALAIGRWRPLGSQGSQVATAAFFAFSTYVAATSDAQRWSQLGQIIVLVLIGCGIGVVVNTLVLPPLRYRSAEYGVHTLAHSLCDLIGDMYPALREGKPDEERTRHWRRRASHLAPIVRQAQSSVHTAWESTFYNPRRLWRRHRHRTSFDGYQAVVDALERVSDQVASMTRSLDQWNDAHADREGIGFARSYGEFLASLARIAELLGQVDEDRLRDQAHQLCEAAAEAQRCRDRLEDDARAGSLPLSDPAQPYGILMAEATRLTDEFQHTCDVLKHGVDTAHATSTAAAAGCEQG